MGFSIFILYGDCMKSNKLEKITESLTKRGMSESAIGKFLNSIKIAIKKKQLDKLTNDPEYQKILKNTTSNLSTTTILNSDTKG